MGLESLEQLEQAMGQWRKTKKSRNTAIPTELLSQARRAAASFGVDVVRKALRIDRRHFEDVVPVTKRGRGRPPKKVKIPGYTKVEVPKPTLHQGFPIAEFESLCGSKLKIFSMTSETMALLSSLCGTGGLR